MVFAGITAVCQRSPRPAGSFVAGGFFSAGKLFLYQLLLAAAASLSVFIFWKATHRYFSEIAATTLTAFFAANPVFLYRSGTVMPEIPALAVGLYLWWKQDRLSGWAVGGWLLVAYLIRPASVALWGAVWGTLFFHRQWKKLFLSSVFPLLGLAAWIWWCHGQGDTNFDGANEVYAVNTVGHEFMRRPIPVKVGELVRIHLINIVEFDLINSFHLHAMFFNYYDTGSTLEPTLRTVDTIMQAQGQRGMLEFRPRYPGRYMFHAHVSEFTELGWMGFFNAVNEADYPAALAETGLDAEWDRKSLNAATPAAGS